jgi:antitoxin MazE
VSKVSGELLDTDVLVYAFTCLLNLLTAACVLADRLPGLDFKHPQDIHTSLYIKEHAMRVSKWGNSLAIRLPAAVVEALELKAGDEVEVHVIGDRTFAIDRDRTRERALARIRALSKALPADWKFDREEANAR